MSLPTVNARAVTARASAAAPSPVWIRTPSSGAPIAGARVDATLRSSGCPLPCEGAIAHPGGELLQRGARGRGLLGRLGLALRRRVRGIEAGVRVRLGRVHDPSI